MKKKAHVRMATWDSPGQVPHPVGMWVASRMRRPWVYVMSVVMRTLALFDDTVGVVSTRMTAFPAELISVRPAFCASV